jgi:ornithine cyclodeaminase/alanine dehydrogenase-like protein (mu-crystallin family)
MLILDGAQMTSLLSLQQVIGAVEQSMIAYEHGEAMAPQRMHLDHEKNTLLCMPSWGSRYFGTKLVTVMPGNRGKGLPVTNGAMLLNDGETGVPLAILQASKLTALRTGALGAIGIKYITPPDASSIGLIGCGVQGIHQAVFACAVRSISTIHYLHRTDEGSSRLLSFVKNYFPHVVMERSDTTDELLNKTNIIIASTTASEPVLPNDEDKLRGKHFVSIGSYKPSMQELPDAIYRLADKLFIDSEFARHETGDTINPVKKGLLKEEDIFTLGKLITRKVTVDINKTTVYKSAGMAIFDLFVAQAMYEQAIKMKIGTSVEFA